MIVFIGFLFPSLKFMYIFVGCIIGDVILHFVMEYIQIAARTRCFCSFGKRIIIHLYIGSRFMDRKSLMKEANSQELFAYKSSPKCLWKLKFPLTTKTNYQVPLKSFRPILRPMIWPTDQALEIINISLYIIISCSHC